MTAKGFVSLVGSGPGDPELLTLKALRLMQQADVVVYDRLVSAEIMALVPHGVSQISVGKSPGKHCVPQDQINEIIVSLARSGRRVVRLKGGDPCMFGRITEELGALQEHGIDFEIVPGITAGMAAGAYSGVMITDRTHSSQVVFITGHEAAGKDQAGGVGIFVRHMGRLEVTALHDDIGGDLHQHGMGDGVDEQLITGTELALINHSVGYLNEVYL